MKFILSLIFLIASTSLLAKTSNYALVLPNKEVIPLQRIMYSDAARQKGLSNAKPSEFPNDVGALFVGQSESVQAFWMPMVLFDLDIIYLDSNLKIVHIDRLSKHPTMKEPIPRGTPTICKYVLEMRSSGELNKKLKVGMKLTWKGDVGLEQIKQDIHQKQ